MERIKNFLFINTSTKQTVIKNTFWLFVGDIGVKVLKLFLFVYAARKLGTSEWGVFSYTIALMSTFAIISDIGINTVISREAAKKMDNMREYISTGFFLKLGLSIISSLALLSMLFFINDSNAVKVLIPITAFMLFFDSITGFGFILNRAFEKMEMEAFIKIITTIILIILGFIFISKNPKAISLSYSYVISGFIGVIIMYFSLRSYFINLVSSFNKKLLKYIFKEALPMAIIFVIGTIMSNLDMIILGWFTDSSNIGLYSAAQKPIQIVYLIPTLLVAAISPVFSRLAITDKEKVRTILKKSLRISLIIAIVVNVFIFAVGGFIFDLMFGAQYKDAIPLFKIMGLAIITGAPSLIISNAIFAFGKQKELVLFIAISLLLNIILCLLLIPQIGIYGAAISVTAAQTIGNIILIIRSKKILA
jgi:O-antigen/teichoic acid export membrane protein